MLDKMKYALSDIQITYALLQIKNSSFFKRAISRLIPIRMPDLIRYSREVNNDLSYGRSPKERLTMRENLNALDALYKDYMADLRNKFGGHLKDIDFFERIQLWGQINEDDIQFFVSHAEEFASALAADTGMTTIFVINKADSDAIARISAHHNLEGKPTFASDALALTRYNTVSAIQVHELPAKANLLASLRIIINYELSLLREIRQSEVVRAVKYLLLVDVINFFDNLFTRPVDPSAKQAMDGLDVIVGRHGLGTAVNIFKVAKAETRIVERAEALRSTRNVVAAHLDPHIPLPALKAQLDGVSLDEISQIYDLMNKLFEAVCRSELTLSTVLLGPTPMPGVIAVSQQPQSGFAKNDSPQTTFSAPSYSASEMEQMWETLKQSPNDQEALTYFRTAMMNSPVEEQWSETSQLGEHAWRTETHDIRSVHKFLQRKLHASLGNDEKTSSLVIHVMVHGKNTFPITLLHILEEEYKDVVKSDITGRFIFAFGELARVRDRRVVDILKQRSESGDLDELYTSLIALLKIDVRDNGVRHLNGNVPSLGPGTSDGKLDGIILERLNQLPAFYQTVLVLTMLGELWLNPFLGTYVDYTKTVYFPTLESILRLSVSELLVQSGVSTDKIADIIKGIANRAYSSISIQLGDALKEVAESQAQVFYEIVARDYIPIDWRQDVLVQLRAIALARLGNFEDALTIASYLCDMKPHLKHYRIFALELAAEAKLPTQFEDIYSKLERDFILEPQDIVNVERMKMQF